MDDMNMKNWQIKLNIWFTLGEPELSTIYKTATSLSGKFSKVNDIIEYHKKVIERLNSEL